MLNWKCLKFEELDNLLFYQILKMRQDVFIVEQFCPYDDLDGKDEKAKHLCGFVDQKLVAYARLFKKGENYENYSTIGRIVVEPAERGKKYGIALIEKGLSLLKKWEPNSSIKIEAQGYLKNYYAKFGFSPKGKPFDLDGIFHFEMFK